MLALIIAMMAAVAIACAVLAYAFSDAHRARRHRAAAARTHYARTSQ